MDSCIGNSPDSPETRNLLSAIVASINSLRYFTCLPGGKTFGVKKIGQALHVLLPRYGTSLKEPDRNCHCGCVEYGVKTQGHDCTNDGNSKPLHCSCPSSLTNESRSCLIREFMIKERLKGTPPRCCLCNSKEFPKFANVQVPLFLYLIVSKYKDKKKGLTHFFKTVPDFPQPRP